MHSTSSQPVHGIRAWRARDRPRERLLREGADRLATAELLSLCIGSGVQGADAVVIGRTLLQRFGSTDGVLSAPPTALLACPGIGVATVARLKAIHELCCRCTEAAASEQALLLDGVDKVSKYLQRRIGWAEREVFGCLFLDARNRLISWEPLFFGSVNRAHVHTREVLKRGLALNSASAILAHNHPSGCAEPSAADLHITQELVDLLGRVDIQVLDHIVVAGDQAVSFAARGLLPAR